MRAVYMVLFLSAVIAKAQTGTEIYLANITNENGQISLGTVENISKNPGYDNQPSFWSDSKSVLYARTINGQTEIARFFIEDKRLEIISNTEQGSEYSPTQIPGSNNISSIRLDTTGLQLLYEYTLKGKSKPIDEELVVGYHAWLSKKQAVTFVLGNPITMQLIDKGKVSVLGENIGRSLHKVPNAEIFSFLDKSVEPWVISTMHPETKEITKLTTAIEDSEDYAWLSETQLIMASGSDLFCWTEGQEWEKISYSTTKPLGGITRLAVSPDGKLLALVVNEQ